MIKPCAQTLVTGPVIYPLTLMDVKDQLRLEYEDNSGAGTTTESAAIVYVDADTFTVAGDVRLVYLPGRYIEVTQTGPATGYVESVAYNSGPDTTSITVNSGLIIDAGISAVKYGDSGLVGYIKAATSRAEVILGRKLISQTWNIYYDEWPAGRSFYLPFGDVSLFTSLKYTDEDESQSTVATTVYAADTDSVPCKLYLKPDQSWPTDTLWPSNPIVAQSVFGYGSTAASVPEDIRNAMLLMIDDMNEHRGTKVVGTVITETDTEQLLLYSYRMAMV